MSQNSVVAPLNTFSPKDLTAKKQKLINGLGNIQMVWLQLTDLRQSVEVSLF